MDRFGSPQWGACQISWKVVPRLWREARCSLLAKTKGFSKQFGLEVQFYIYIIYILYYLYGLKKIKIFICLYLCTCLCRVCICVCSYLLTGRFMCVCILVTYACILRQFYSMCLYTLAQMNKYIICICKAGS